MPYVIDDVKIAPKGDIVFIKCAQEEVKSLGGILLPESATRKPTSGTVIDVGDGRTGKEETYVFTLKKGDSVRARPSKQSITCAVLGDL